MPKHTSLDDQITGLKAKIDRLIDEAKPVPAAKRRALVKLILARQKWRRRKLEGGISARHLGETDERD